MVPPASSPASASVSRRHGTTHGNVAASYTTDFALPKNRNHSDIGNPMADTISSTAFPTLTGQVLASQDSIGTLPDAGSRRQKADGRASIGTGDFASRDAANLPPIPTLGTTVTQLDPHHECSNPRPQKRQKLKESRMSYPRRRAVTACQICRIRKTKCDNQRPTCGSCSSLSVECNYQDQKSDLSSFDPASLHILDKLNYTIQLIENQAQTLARAELLASLQSHSQSSVWSPDGAGPAFGASVPSGGFSGHSLGESPHFEDLLDDNAATLSEALGVVANCSSAHVLEWPIFERYSDLDDITAPFFEASALPDTSQRHGPNFSHGVQQEDVSSLIPDFINHVHIKNPILDSSELKSMARQMSENGFGWDGPSCLVLIACALANLSVPFTLDQPGKNDISYLDARDYSSAEAYYNASRKRIGLLGNSILATQCYFLIGVYEMYSLRPLPAWLSFNRACTTFQAYLRTPSRHSVSSRSSRRLEQRLYWSCLKSECEMRDEIDLPPTGLAKVEYPDMFPSPPGGTPAPRDNDESDLPGPLEPMFQRSWYYYLSEIAYRRIANRISHALYKTEHHSWHTVPLERMQRIAEELEAQVIQWSEHIPRPVAFEDMVSPDELTYMLQARFLDLRECIWRPFLYLAIHHTATTTTDEVTIFTYAQRSLESLIKCINHRAIKHRHHGSWYACRALFTMSLVLLAATMSRKIAVPSEWRASVDLALTCLQYWEAEAPDLRPARLTLLRMLGDIEGQSPTRLGETA